MYYFDDTLPAVLPADCAVVLGQFQTPVLTRPL